MKLNIVIVAIADTVIVIVLAAADIIIAIVVADTVIAIAVVVVVAAIVDTVIPIVAIVAPVVAIADTVVIVIVLVIVVAKAILWSLTGFRVGFEHQFFFPDLYPDIFLRYSKGNASIHISETIQYSKSLPAMFGIWIIILQWSSHGLYIRNSKYRYPCYMHLVWVILMPCSCKYLQLIACHQ